MKKKVAIVGYASDVYCGDTELSSEDMGFTVAKRAREKAGVNRVEIGSVHNSTMDFFDGITISNGILLPAAGGYDRDGTRVQNGGVFAIISACASILCGASEVAVISSADAVAYNMLKVTNFSSDVFFNQPLGYNNLISYALFCSAYMKKYGIYDEDVAMVAAQNYAAGMVYPRAHIKNQYTPEQIVNSPVVSFPMTSYEVATHSSFGGSALVVTSEEKAKEYTNTPIWVSGIGMATSAIDFESLLEMSALKLAASAAYQTAGINDPLNELDVAEISNPFALYELAIYESLGFCAEGESVGLVRDGFTTSTGKLPVNVSGGTLCTNAPNSNGLFKTVAALEYLNNNQKARRALVHDGDMSIGLAGESHAVLILEKGE